MFLALVVVFDDRTHPSTETHGAAVILDAIADLIGRSVQRTS